MLSTLALLFSLNTPTITPQTLFIDEIDGQVARVVQQDRVFCVPSSLLPVNAREGMTLQITITITSPETGADDLRARMARGDDHGTIKL